MRYSEDHKAQTRQRIVEEAARRFRRDGVEATGLQPLMKALGLTHGGFYAHFKSKDELVENALQHSAEQIRERAERALTGEKPLQTFIDRYLSPAHRDNAAEGCPLPTLCAELGQRGQPSPLTDASLRDRLSRIEACLPDEDAADKSVTLLCTLVGALLLSRSVSDPELSAQLLDSARAQLTKQYVEQDAS
ncbi:TetR/AcrR family transcriptional regulator [Stutzerimonas azotifigens]|uniref:TetR/AcrR family transcriptional regulator n=1 Tax=Stutzerimonas azotifigens TaxID=291995 RepID=A0ABR5Z6P3_9GAMM|nr:TetR/AcrR family transcriptional regulator [Stutzerimonas azotifigens]MBA1275891.1 TetR/AcrR family transcriptional regulator [Stutzerimonas azotifigens]